MNYRTLGVVLAVALFAGPVLAHHNMSAIYDFNDRVTMTGTLTKMDWRNPHIELTVSTKDGNQVQQWALEGPSPTFFRAREVTKADIEAALNKTVTAEGSRARDGSSSALLRTMTLPNGKVLSACPQNC